MIKKIAVLAAVLAFSSVSSATFACGTSCKDRNGKGDAKTELVSGSSFDTFCCGSDSCGSDKNKEKA